MPPKKSNSEKAIAKELKKKNTEEAKKIISSLIPSTITTVDMNTSSTILGAGTENSTSVDVYTPAEIRKKANSKKNQDKTDDKSALKRTSRKSSQSLNVAKISENVDLPSSSKIRARSSNEKNMPKRIMKTVANHAGFNYEIDCSRVSDSIDVFDLKKYLEMQLKVNGKKSNFGDTVTVRCEDQKAVIKAKVYLPKRSLRFLSKKFLKKEKAWNIQVISKNKNSYEYKYVGTA